jgi:DNA topoisomerase-1
MDKTKKNAPRKSSKKPPTPSVMNEYCYKITGTLDTEKLKKYLERKIYRNPKFPGHFTNDEDLPFVIILSTKDNIICIKLTSRARKNIERIESIHKKLKSKDLAGGEFTLSKPEIFELEQCNWWGGGCKFGEIQKWKTLEHNGPYFSHISDPYKPHKAPLIYNKKKYILTPSEEKIANYYAYRILSERKPNITVYWTKDPVFNKNFFEDFKTYLSPEHKTIFKEWSKFNFEKIADKLNEIKTSETKEEKAKKKAKAAERKHDYGYAIINGTKEPVGNFTVEPGSIFLGRGENPKRGKIKKDIFPEDVTINIGEKAKVPKAPKGHKWGNITHNHEVSWLASWTDTITNEAKYVQFAAEGQLKGKSDFFKYEKARKLNHFIKEVRERYHKDIVSTDLVKRQLGTVIYLIDHYGLRAGGEKSKDDTDTVGASTLRVEHIKLKEPDILIFDFLGKDSIRYYKEIKVTKDIYKNIGEFIKNKNKGGDLFDKISAPDINAYLKTFDKNFTAKVFRTRLASTLMYNELKKIILKKKDSEADKKLKFDKANVAVAEILNHQRTVSVKNKEVIEKYQKQLKDLKKEMRNKKNSGGNIDGIKKRIETKTKQIQSKSDTLNVAINTSRANYIDPRIVVSWCLDNDLEISKVYTAPMQKKFNWAISTTDAEWDYYTTPLFGGMNILEPVETLKLSSTGKYKSPRRKSIQTSKTSKTPTYKPPSKPPSKPPTSKPPKISKILFLDFSARSIIIIGGSEDQKKKLREMGGILNPSFSYKEKGISGFIFPKDRENELRTELKIDEISKGNYISFYMGETPSFSGYMFNDILSWGKIKLEQKHDYIQSLFPLKTKSSVVDAPVLTDNELEKFKTDNNLRYKIYKSYMKMMWFYGYDVNIIIPSITRVSPIDDSINGITVGLFRPHNFNRISRMLQFLRMSNFSLLAYLLVFGLCEDISSNSQFKDLVLYHKSIQKWIKSLNISEDELRKAKKNF